METSAPLRGGFSPIRRPFGAARNSPLSNSACRATCCLRGQIVRHRWWHSGGHRNCRAVSHSESRVQIATFEAIVNESTANELAARADDAGIVDRHCHGYWPIAYFEFDLCSRLIALFQEYSRAKCVAEARPSVQFAKRRKRRTQDAYRRVRGGAPGFSGTMPGLQSRLDEGTRAAPSGVGVVGASLP